MEVDRNGLEVLDRSACLRLLATGTLGRLGITYGALPTVLPVNYRLVDDTVVFRTSVGTKLAAATTGVVVAFQVDDMDPLWHTGWSVVVTGVAEAVSDPERLDRLERANIPRWAPLGESRLIQIDTNMISGRRLLSPAPVRSSHPDEAQTKSAHISA